MLEVESVTNLLSANSNQRSPGGEVFKSYNSSAIPFHQSASSVEIFSSWDQHYKTFLPKRMSPIKIFWFEAHVTIRLASTRTN